MAQLLAPLLSFLLLYKYAALFLITFAAALAVPLPSGALTVAAFFFASQGYLSFGWVAVAGLAGNIAGDLVGYALVRRFGRPFFARFGLERLLRAPAVRLLEEKFARYPGITIVLSRFTTALTPAANVLAALAPVPFGVFLVFDVIGETGEMTLNLVYGWLFGDSLAAFSSLTGRLAIISLVVLALLFVLLWKRRVSHERGDKS